MVKHKHFIIGYHCCECKLGKFDKQIILIDPRRNNRPYIFFSEKPYEIKEHLVMEGAHIGAAAWIRLLS